MFNSFTRAAIVATIASILFASCGTQTKHIRNEKQLMRHIHNTHGCANNW